MNKNLESLVDIFFDSCQVFQITLSEYVLSTGPTDPILSKNKKKNTIELWPTGSS